MSRLAFCSATVLALITSVALAQGPSMGQEQQKAPQDQPQGRTSAPNHTVPPTGEAQPKAPIADQAAPAAVGPSQANTAASVPSNGPLGATGQTMPSTISADNAKLDKLPTTALQFPLTDDQKKLIAKSIAGAPAAAAPDLADVHVTSFLPEPIPALSDFSPDVMNQIPGVKNYKYVKADKRVLIIDPPNQAVVGEITE
ncbi:MAG: hypothetical protein WDO17_25695 [Alphaproteobacteria bacterium]